MTRTKRGYIARRRRTKSRLSASHFRGAHARLTRAISQQELRALVSAHRDRGRQKINFRRLWIDLLPFPISVNEYGLFPAVQWPPHAGLLNFE